MGSLKSSMAHAGSAAIDCDSMPPLLVTIDDAARTLSMSKHTIIKWVKSGAAPSVKVGSRRLIEFAELQKVATEGLKTP
jgi:excisionase family DNA binding protein